MRTNPGSERHRTAWEEHHVRLWRAVVVWTGDAELASDAVAEAFAQLIRRGEAVTDPGAWVWRSAFRIAGGLLAERGKVVVRAEPRGGRVGGGIDPSLPDEVIALADALGRLGELDRTVVVLSLVGGWSAADVATAVGTTSGAVRVRLHRARKALHQALEDDDG